MSSLYFPMGVLMFAFSGSDAVMLDQGKTHLAAKQAELAESVLNSCVTLSPKNVQCQWELGWAHYLQRDFKSVVQAWERVKTLSPDHPELAENLANAQAQVEADASGEAVVDLTPRLQKAPANATLRLRAVGDVMIGTDFPEGHLPEDSSEILKDVTGLLKDADLTFINLEGPLCDNGETKKCKKGQNCYAFRSPTKYVQHLVDAGVDLASTANNHSGDFGTLCRTETEGTLDKAGIAWSGRVGTVAHIEKNGLRVSMIGFHTGDGVNYVNDHKRAAKLVAKQAKNNDIVIVSFHGGAEGSKAVHVPDEMEIFYGEKRGHLRKFVRVVIDAGADLVLGHGPHVARGMEIYNDRLITYSMGNFATYGRFNLSGPLGMGMVLDVTLDREGKFKAGKIIATKQVGKGIAVPDDKGKVIKLVRKLSQQDFPSGGLSISKDGELSATGGKPVM